MDEGESPLGRLIFLGLHYFSCTPDMTEEQVRARFEEKFKRAPKVVVLYQRLWYAGPLEMGEK